jgi:PAS domain-containing protein
MSVSEVTWSDTRGSFLTLRLARDLLLSYFPIEAANGTIDRAACILRDITDRKRAEEALLGVNRALDAQAAVLQSRQELLKIFVKNVPAGVAI